MLTHWTLRGIALLAVTGCTSLVPFSAGLIAPPPAAPPEPTVAAPRELPPAQVALVCWNAAEEMRKNGFDREAIEQYEKVRAAEPQRPRVAWRLAVLYDRLGDNVRALAEYERALQAEPRNPDLYNDVGYYHYQRGDWKNAEARFRQAISLDAKHTRAIVNLGLTLGHQERFHDCAECFHKVLPPAQAHCNMGVLLSHHGRHEEARRAFQEALKHDPTLTQASHLVRSLDAPPAKP